MTIAPSYSVAQRQSQANGLDAAERCLAGFIDLVVSQPSAATTYRTVLGGCCCVGSFRASTVEA